MATHAEPGISAPARDLSPYPTDYTSWKVMAWMGFAFITAFFCLWGLLARNISPFPAWAPPEAVWQNYKDHRLGIMIGMSVCLTMSAFYMSWSVAIARVMERIEGPGGVLSKLEMMGGTITCAPLMTACAMWLTAAHEVHNLDPGVVHMLYWMGWLLIDLAYFVTSLQIAGVSIVFMRDKREKKLVPDAVIWWGWITFASFFVVVGKWWARWLVGTFSVVVLVVQPLLCFALLGLDGLLRDGVPMIITAGLGLYALHRSRGLATWVRPNSPPVATGPVEAARNTP